LVGQAPEDDDLGAEKVFPQKPLKKRLHLLHRGAMTVTQRHSANIRALANIGSGQQDSRGQFFLKTSRLGAD
jgi:hypothetical protein